MCREDHLPFGHRVVEVASNALPSVLEGCVHDLAAREDNPADPRVTSQKLLELARYEQNGRGTWYKILRIGEQASAVFGRLTLKRVLLLLLPAAYGGFRVVLAGFPGPRWHRN